MHATTAVPLVHQQTRGSTRSPTINWASKSETKAHTTQSLCTFGQPTSRVAPELPFEATQHNRGGFRRQQQRTSAIANDAGTKPHLTRQTRQLVQPQPESCGLPHPRTQSITAFSSDASLSEVLVPSNSKGLAPHGANFGSLVASPPVPPHWKRHGIMVGADQVHVQCVRGQRGRTRDRISRAVR